MNLREMQYIVAVADLRNFGRAAEHCHVSQPTLSGQIKKLEQLLGVVLFERTNRRVMVTPVGQQVIASARRMLREVETMQEIAESARDPLAGKFRLGAFPTIATYLFPNLVKQVRVYLPKLRLILVEEKTAELLTRLHRGELDAAILALPIADDYLTAAPLFEDHFQLAVPEGHALADKLQITQSELHQYQLLLLEEGHCLRDQALEVCQLHGIAEEQDYKATSLETLRQMVKAGAGITFMPESAMLEGEAGIRYIPFGSPAPSRTIGLVWRKTSPRGAVMEQLTQLMVG